MTDALILGAGLAGSTAATLIAQTGRSVRLLERQAGPHHKVCGEFLSIEAHDHLTALGIDTIALGGVAIDTVQVISGKRMVESRLPFTALGLSRFRLDEALIERAVSAGAIVERGIRVRSAGDTQAQTSVGDREAAMVMLATGKQRMRAKESDDSGHGDNDPFVGFKMHLCPTPQARKRLKGRIILILFDGGYAGLQMIEGGRANVCLVIRKARLKHLGGTWGNVWQMLCTLPHCSDLLADAEPLFENPCTIANLSYGLVPDQAATDGIIRLGDQAGMTASLTGDGMAAALRSAFIAAQCVAEGRDVLEYRAQHKAQIQVQIRRAMALQRLQDSRLPKMAGMMALELWPGLLKYAARATRLGPW